MSSQSTHSATSSNSKDLDLAEWALASKIIAMGLSDQFPPHITPLEYLERELVSEIRHEYAGGQVYAMAGASAQHEEIGADLFTDLRNHLEGKPCRAYKSDLKLRMLVNQMDTFFYPDIMVSCDPMDNHRYYREKPTVLIEILSEDEKRDLVEKFLIYSRIESLEEYIVLSQDPRRPKAYIHRRVNNWQQEVIVDGNLEIPSIEFSTPLLRLYCGAAALD
jgi:Uma2 family endonuclease